MTARLLRILPLVLLLVSCQQRPAPSPTPQERQAAAQAERNRKDLDRCLRDRDGLRRQLAELRQTRRQLAQVKADVYVAAPRPRPMDPALAARFSLADQELDNIRYQQAVARWRQEEGRRYAEWLQQHTSLQQRLEKQELQELNRLRQLNSSLFDPAEPNALVQTAVEKYSSCKPERFLAAAPKTGQ
jgi:DNA repair exonuclease SbcCD ATPase subunit